MRGRLPLIALLVFFGIITLPPAHSLPLCQITPSDNTTCSGYVNLLAGQNITVQATGIVLSEYVEVDFQADDVNISLYILSRTDYNRHAKFPDFPIYPRDYAQNVSTHIQTSGDLFVVLLNSNNVSTYVNYTVTFSDYDSAYLTITNAVAAIIVCVILLAIFQCVLRCCCCCCHVSNRNAPYYRDYSGGKQYKFEMPPPPLASFALPKILPITSKYISKPMVPYTVYCFNANDLLWVLYPAINEPLVTPARIYTTALNLLFVFTFQSVWGLFLLGSLSELGRPLAWVVSTLGTVLIISCVVTVFQAILRPIIRVIAFRKERMLFASSESEGKQKFGIVLNYLIIVTTLAMAGGCVYQAYRTGLHVFVNNFALFSFALVGRMYIPGLITNFVFFHLFSTFGGIPDAVLVWDQYHNMYFIQGVPQDRISESQLGTTQLRPKNNPPTSSSSSSTYVPTSSAPSFISVSTFIQQQKLRNPNQFFSPKGERQPLLQQHIPPSSSSPSSSPSSPNRERSDSVDNNSAILVGSIINQ